MPITLAEANRNTQTDLDVTVIDEFRKESVVLDTMLFDDVVNPAGGGATMAYGYRRLKTQPTADFRELNTEYTPVNVETEHHVTGLAVLGGTFQIDRVIAKLGPAASGGVALNMRQKVKATSTKFQDAVINGDTAVEAHGFDGLDKALAGSSTEMVTAANWQDLDTDPSAPHKALDLFDEFLSLLDGTPTVILGNAKALAKVRAIVRRSSMYNREPVEGLMGANGRPITRENYGGIFFADPGNKAGTNSPIIPITGGKTSLYAYRVALDGFHAISTAGGQLIESWLPDFSNVKAVQEGGVELGPVGVALKSTKSAAVLRDLTV
ncbi:phage capsid protein [Leucobacter viscericola]|uniref:Phage capsid protein n=1 Tax=Leucobacter viscericola TaxID=2714935 RepID=A0A6G7XHW7_9MICO|nr:phage capsid protein [Leucobacter viscericola]QIK64155.1 phage capsid protein [Leucobacter viscericola]